MKRWVFLVESFLQLQIFQILTMYLCLDVLLTAQANQVQSQTHGVSLIFLSPRIWTKVCFAFYCISSPTNSLLTSPVDFFLQKRPPGPNILSRQLNLYLLKKKQPFLTTSAILLPLFWLHTALLICITQFSLALVIQGQLACAQQHSLMQQACIECLLYSTPWNGEFTFLVFPNRHQIPRESRPHLSS